MNPIIHKTLFVVSIILLFLLHSGCRGNKNSNFGASDANVYWLEKELKSGNRVELENQQIDLQGKTIAIKGTLILGNNTRIFNGILHGEGGKISSSKMRCFSKIQISGNWQQTFGYMDWFTDGSNSKENFNALANLVQLNATIQLDKIYNLSTISTFVTNKDIKIIGNDKNQAGFILDHQLQKNVGYFSGDKGSNVHLENILLKTGTPLNKTNRSFIFASCFNSSKYPNANPSFESFKLINCKILGEIAFSYASNKNFQRPSDLKLIGVKNIEIRDCHIENTKSLLSFRRAPYELVVIENNNIRNISGPVFFFPLSQKKMKNVGKLYDFREKMTLRNNVVKNDIIVSDPRTSYLALVIAKGKDFVVKNNRIENLLSKVPACETYSFYCSASNQLIVEGNTAINCFNYERKKEGDKKLLENTLLKLKGAVNANVRGNTFKINKKALVKVGLLANSNSLLSSINCNNFRINLICASGRSRIKKNKYFFDNNIFELPYLNDYGTIARQVFIFTSNTINIGYVDNSPKDNWGDVGHHLSNTLFYMRGVKNNKKILFSNNEINVSEMKGKELKITSNPISIKEYQSIEIVENKINIKKGKATFYEPKAIKSNIKY